MSTDDFLRRAEAEDDAGKNKAAGESNTQNEGHSLHSSNIPLHNPHSIPLYATP